MKYQTLFILENPKTISNVVCSNIYPACSALIKINIHTGSAYIYFIVSLNLLPQSKNDFEEYPSVRVFSFFSKTKFYCKVL